MKQEIKKFITESNIVFYDIETDYGNTILIHALLNDRGEKLVFIGTYTDDLIYYLNNKMSTTTIIGFNLSFDLGHLVRQGLALNKVIVHDLRMMYLLARNTLELTRASFSLAIMTKNMLSIDMDKTIRSTFRGMTISEVTQEHLDYAFNDIVNLPSMYKTLLHEIKVNDLLRAFEFEVKFHNCLIQVETNGINIDYHKCKEMYDSLNSAQSSLLQQITDLSGVGPRTAKFKRILSDIGYKVPTTEKGALSLAYEGIVELLPIEGDLIFPLYLEYIKSQKMMESLYNPAKPAKTDKKEDKGILSFVTPDYTRLHTGFNQLGTVTGRMTAYAPNLLTFDKRLRSIFTAPKGSKIVSIDWSSQEPLVGASLANCQKSLDKYYDPDGYHNANLKMIYKLLYDKDLDKSEFKTVMFNEKKSFRDLVKIIGLGVMYGMTATTAASRVKDMSTKKIFQDMIDLLLTPEIVKFWNITANDIITRSYAKLSVLGHKVFINLDSKDFGHFDVCNNMGDLGLKTKQGIVNPTVKNGEKYLKDLNNKIKNFPIQGNSAVIMKHSVIKLTELIRKSYSTVKIVNLVHDEIVFEIPDDLIDEFVPLAEDIMQSSSTLLLGDRLCTEKTVDTYWRK